MTQIFQKSEFGGLSHNVLKTNPYRAILNWFQGTAKSNQDES